MKITRHRDGTISFRMEAEQAKTVAIMVAARYETYSEKKCNDGLKQIYLQRREEWLDAYCALVLGKRL